MPEPALRVLGETEKVITSSPERRLAPRLVQTADSPLPVAVAARCSDLVPLITGDGDPSKAFLTLLGVPPVSVNQRGIVSSILTSLAVWMLTGKLLPRLWSVRK